jgi:hypothetical protein
MADTTDKKSWRDWLSDILTAKEVILLLWTVFGGSIVATRVGAMLPAWDVQDKLFAGMAAFAGGSLGAFALARVALWAGPIIGRRARRFVTGAPYVRATPHNGSVAVLEFTNDGGETALRAKGRIVAVEGTTPRRQDDYPMLWRSDWNQGYIQVPKGTVCKRGHPIKLVVAEYEAYVPDFGPAAAWLKLIGGTGVVDKVSSKLDEQSPVVTIEVVVEADPPLWAPFVRRYSAQIRKKERVITLTGMN